MNRVKAAKYIENFYESRDFHKYILFEKNEIITTV